MIEAQIICCNPCDIPDLGIVGLKRGEQRWVSLAAAQASQDLLKEQSKGNVRVKRKPQRGNSSGRTSPPRPAPPFVAHSRPQRKDSGEPSKPSQVVEHHETVIEKTVVQEVDTDKLKAELLGDLLPGLRSVIAEEVGKVAAQNTPAPQSTPSASLDPAQLESVLESVMRRVGVPTGDGVSSTGGDTRKSSGPKEPMYLPNKIIGKDTKAKIDVAQKASEGGGDLDDAQAALRALRGKKRGRKNGNEENES